MVYWIILEEAEDQSSIKKQGVEELLSTASAGREAVKSLKELSV